MLPFEAAGPDVALTCRMFLSTSQVSLAFTCSSRSFPVIMLFMTDAAPSYSFPHDRRLHGKRAFSAVFDAQMRKPAGPVVAWAVPNDLGHPRLGLSVSRRVGNAVKRNRIKRLLREAFRLTQHDWPSGYDVVLVVRPHEALELADYQAMLRQVMGSIHQQWEKRRRRAEKPEPPAAPA